MATHEPRFSCIRSAMAIPLLEAVRPARRLLADKAYDADSLRQWLAGAKMKAVMPSSAAGKHHIRWIEKPTEGETLSNGSSVGSRTGEGSQHATTASPPTTSPPSLSSQP